MGVGAEKKEELFRSRCCAVGLFVISGCMSRAGGFAMLC